jgi:hypothetical protein
VKGCSPVIGVIILQDVTNIIGVPEQKDGPAPRQRQANEIPLLAARRLKHCEDVAPQLRQEPDDRQPAAHRSVPSGLDMCRVL